MFVKAVRALLLAVLVSGAAADASCIRFPNSVSLLGNHSCFGTTSHAPPPFVPSDETGLKFWFDSTANVVKDGSNNVSAWTEKTSNAYVATATSGKQPIWTDGYSPNGNPCLVFDGVDDFMEFASGVDMVAVGSPQTFFGTIKKTAKAGTYYNTFFSLRSSLLMTVFAFAESNDPTYGNVFWGIFNANTGVRAAAATLSTVSNFLLTYTGGASTATASWTLGIGGASQILTQTVSAGSPSGQHNYIGEWNPTGASLSLKGAVCEWGSYDHVLSGAIQTGLTTYQQVKWGN